MYKTRQSRHQQVMLQPADLLIFPTTDLKVNNSSGVASMASLKLRSMGPITKEWASMMRPIFSHIIATQVTEEAKRVDNSD